MYHEARVAGDARGGRGASGRPLEQLRGGLGGNARFTMVSRGLFGIILLAAGQGGNIRG